MLKMVEIRNCFLGLNEWISCLTCLDGCSRDVELRTLDRATNITKMDFQVIVIVNTQVFSKLFITYVMPVRSLCTY